MQELGNIGTNAIEVQEIQIIIYRSGYFDRTFNSVGTFHLSNLLINITKFRKNILLRKRLQYQNKKA